jgi:hypothetical protein
MPMARLTINSDTDNTDGVSDTEQLLNEQLASSSTTLKKKRKRPDSPEPPRSKRSTAGRKKPRLYD